MFYVCTLFVVPTDFLYMFCMDIGTNSKHFTIKNQLIGFVNRDAKCLLRGTDSVQT